MDKPKIIKEYEKLSEEDIALVKFKYPYGFEKNLKLFKNKDGVFFSALPFETDKCFYLIKITKKEAKKIDEEEEGFDESLFSFDNENEVEDDDLNDY